MDPSSSSSASAAAVTLTGEGIAGGGGGGVPFVSAWVAGVSRRYQHLLDKSTPHVLRRWLGFALLAYVVRVAIIQGFYVVSYALGIYVLSLFISFLSPQVDPRHPGARRRIGASAADEILRRVPPFCSPASRIQVLARSYSKELSLYWNHKLPIGGAMELALYSITKAFFIAFVLTFFSAFDVPVFWPILVMYLFVLFVDTVKRQILHMIKHKYVPFSTGKQQRYGKKPVPAQDTLAFQEPGPTVCST